MKVADLFVDLKLDTSSFTTELNAALASATRKAGDVTVDIKADTSDLDKGIKNSEGGLSKLKTAFKGLAIAGAGLAAVGVGAFAKSVVSAASDAQQSIGATETVFGKFSQSVIKTSDGAAKAFGLSANEYRENANLIGSLLKNQGVSLKDLGSQTESFIGIGSDLAATFGGTTKEAVEALGSALKGEFDPLERYGISLKASTVSAEAWRIAGVKSQSAFDELTTKQQAAAKQQATTNLIMKQSADAQGAFGRETGTLAHQQQVLGAQFDNIKAKVGAVLLPILTQLFMYVNDNLIPAFGQFSQFVKSDLVPAFQNFGSFLQSTVVPVITTLVTTFIEWKGVILPIAGVVLTMVAAYKTYIIVTTAWAAITKAAAAAQLALNLALTANPIGLIIAAIAGLVAAFVILYKKNEDFRNLVNTVWAGIKTAIGGTITFITQTLIPGFVAGFDKVKGAVQAVVGFITEHWKLLVSIIGGPLAAIIILVTSNWNTIKTTISNAITDVKTTVSKVLDSIKGTWNTVLTALKTLAQNIWEAIKADFQAKLQAIKTVVNTVMDAVKTLWSNVLNNLKTTAQNVWDAIKTVFTNQLNAAKTVVNNVTDSIKTLWSNALNALKTTASNVWDQIKTVVSNALTSIKNTVDNITGTIKTIWTNAFNALKNLATTAINDAKQGITTALNAVETAFRTTVTTVKNIWDGLKSAAETPVRFVVNTVFAGLVKAVNVIPGVNAPVPHYASGGVLPGYTPGRDVHQFYSPTGGRLALSGGEAIMRPEWTRMVGGPKMVERMNKQAMKMRGYASGGVFPLAGGSVTNVHSGYGHYAVDINKGSGYDDYGLPVLAYLAGTVSQHYKGDDSYGRWVTLAHDAGGSSLYAHLSGFRTANGAHVSAGTPIGSVGDLGNTGVPPTSHLHFELSEGSLGGASGGGGVPDQGLIDKAMALLKLVTELPGKVKGFLDQVRNMSNTGIGKWVKDGAIGMGNKFIDYVNDKIPDKIAIKFFKDIDLPDNPIPHFADGGYMARNGLAYLHRGEYVTKAAAVRRMGIGSLHASNTGLPVAGSYAGAGNGATVHIDRVEVRETVSLQTLTQRLDGWVRTSGRLR